MSVPARDSDDGPSKDGPLNYAPKKVRDPEPASDPAGAPSKDDAAPQSAPLKRDAAPRSGAVESPEPPWRRSKQRGAFAGDVAAVELRNKLALAPDRLPEPPAPLSNGPRYGRLAGVVVVAAVGFVGYQLGSAPRSSPQVAPQSGQSTQQGLVSERSVAAAYPDPQPPQPVLTSPATAKEIAAPSNEQNADNTVADRKDLQLEGSGLNALAPTQTPSRQHDADEIALMIKTGTDLMANRDFAAARLMYQRAAEAGSAMAAFALAETYDPLVVSRLNARGGVAPDVALAQMWYEKAKDLGSTVAPERLERLARLPESPE